MKVTQSTQRLATGITKEELISSLKSNTIALERVIANSREDPETKEKLANFMSFILEILDIENERLIFEPIKNKKRAGRVLRQDKVVHK